MEQGEHEDTEGGEPELNSDEAEENDADTSIETIGEKRKRSEDVFEYDFYGNSLDRSGQPWANTGRGGISKTAYDRRPEQVNAEQPTR